MIGGSVGGLFAAGLLRNAGWNATIFERSKNDLDARGAGVGITRELMEVMNRIGANLDPSLGVTHESGVWLGADGVVRHVHPHATSGSSWARIYRAARAAYPDEHYRAGHELVNIEQDAESVTAIFADGSRETGDLLIAADGNQSTIRNLYQPDVKPRYAGYVAWRGIVDGRDVPASTHETVGNNIIFSFDDGGFMLTMPVPGEEGAAEADNRRYYFIWYRPAASEQALRDLFTDETGKHHGTAIPPPLIRGEHLDKLRDDAAANCAPPIAEVVRRTPQPLLQAISDFESPRLVFGRVALMGDAAFIARPHVAGGISKAALDASRLAEALAGNSSLPEALRAYEEAQMDFGGKIVAHSRKLGYYIEHDQIDNPTAELKMFRDPVHVLTEYGAPHLLHPADVSKFGQKV